MEIDAHTVVPDADAAAAWYARAFGAEEESRIPFPADVLWSRALEAGAEIHYELADQFWGERHGQLTDPFGHRWNIAQHVRDVPADEIAVLPHACSPQADASRGVAPRLRSRLVQ